MTGISRAVVLPGAILGFAWTSSIDAFATFRATAQTVNVEQVLDAAGAYLEDYIRQVPAIVSEEHYRQTITQVRASTSRFRRELERRLVSDVAVVAAPQWSAGWVSFRDVQSVDGEPLRDRVERISALFAKTAEGDPLVRADRMTEESARYNLNGFGLEINRTVNYPMMALRYLRADHQPRSRFALDEMDRVEGLRVAVVSFAEDAMPRLIASFDDSAATGRFWIEPATGRVVRTELQFETKTDRGTARVEARIEVRFRDVARLGMWLPHRMNEDYRAHTRSGPIRITGRAEYSNFRKFDVDVATIVKRDGE